MVYHSAHRVAAVRSVNPALRYKRYAMLAAAVLFSAGAAANAAQVSETWTGGTGNWELNTNWNPQTIPDNVVGTTYNVFIDNGVTGTNSVVTMTASHTIDNLTVDLGDALGISNAQTLTIANNITNNGTITVNSNQGGNGTFLTFTNGTLSGTGTLILNNNGSTAQLNGTVIQSLGSTIQGVGQINAALTNNGIVNANMNGQTLTLQTSSMTNNNLMEATNSGALSIGGITITQGAGGNIKADGGTVNLTGGTTISGGTLTSANSGTIVNSGTNTLASITNSSDFKILNNSTTNITGNLVDNGTIVVNTTQGGNGTFLTFDGGTLSGTGTITLNSAGTSAQLNGTLTQSSGHAIQGFGQINATLTNHGLVNASVSAQSLNVLGTSVTNTSTMEATNGGTLHFGNSVAVTNTGGSITANGGNVVFDASASVTGGTLTSTGTNFLEFDSASITNATLSASSLLRTANNTNAQIFGTLTNNGSIVVNYNQGGNGTFLTFNGAAILAGTGTITLNNAGSTAQLITATSATVTQGATHTIQGIGQINAALTNNGTINANVNGTALTLMITAMTNNNLIEATNGGILNISGLTITQGASGQIKSDGSTVNFTGTPTISGGTLSSPNGGVIVNTDGITTLSGITNNATFRINNGSTVHMTGNIVNNGAITVNFQSGGNGTFLDFNGGTLSGTGSITLNSGTTNAQLTGSLTQSSGHTIQGFGQIGAALINNGTVNANVSGQTIVLTGNNITNNSILEATAPAAAVSSGSLNIGGITITQGASGNIIADGINGTNPATVTLTGGVTISGGKITTSNGGIFVDSGVNALDSLTSNADFRINNGSTTNITGNLVDNGTITVNFQGGGNGTFLHFDGGTLSGTGTIVLNSGTTNAQLTGSLTQSSGHTIQGFGQLSANLTNNGIVNANVSGQTLNVLNSAITNTSTMEATNGGVLGFTSGIAVTNTGGLISANGGNVTFQSGASITGGHLASTGTSFMEMSTASLTDVTVDASSTIKTDNATTATISGTLTNNGNILVNLSSGGNSTSLLFNGAATVTGSGTITLNSAGTNANVSTATASSLIQGASHTIQGFGTLNAAFTNNGTVNANILNQTLNVNGNPMTNNNLMEATNGGTLAISGITLTQGVNGHTKADGSTVTLSNTTISGGTLDGPNSGAFVSTATTTLDSLTNNADFRINNATTTNVTGNLVDNGTITVNFQGGGNSTFLTFNGGTLSGTGLIKLNSAGINAQLNGTLTQASGHTIAGLGQINALLTNQGLVNANAGGVLGITAANSNTGTYEASNGSVLNITGDVAQDDAATAGVVTAGTYEALAGSTLAITLPAQHVTQIGANATVILSGLNSIFTSGGGQIDATLTTINGNLQILANRDYTTTNALTNSGTVLLGGGTLTTPSFTNSTSGSLLKGFGTIAVRPTNHGTIESAGGTLVFADGILHGSGTIQIDAGSTMDLSGGSSGSSADNLIHNGSAAGSLILGNNNVTVAVSYTNASFGSGNSFNKHANVSTTGGKILAAGDNIQSLTGPAGIAPGTTASPSFAGGTTAIPTLNFGSVHVGTSPSLAYQINNTGATGPQMLFALQTSVNGGNITDSRISSSAGVTAGNVGPVALGASSGSLGVTFNATGDGALTGQTLHIANNFDNNTSSTLAEQTLSITGSAWNLAAPVVGPTPVSSTSTINFGNFHETGATVAQNYSVTNNAPADGFSEKLDAAVSGASGNITIAGNISLLDPGVTNSSAIAASFTRGAGSAGAKSGTATLALSSDGQAAATPGNSGLGSTGLSSVTLSANATVYRLAAPGTITSTSYNAGIVHVGDSVTRNPSFSNTAANDGFSETLQVQITTATGAAGVTSGSTNGLVHPGSSNSGFVSVYLDTTTAQLGRTGSQTFHFKSDGSNPLGAGDVTNNGLGVTDLPASDQSVSITADVLNYAKRAAEKSSGNGTLTVNTADHATLDFGTIANGASVASVLDILNSADGPSDTLAGTFTLNAPDFTLSGFGAFSGIGAGANESGLDVGFSSTTAGLHTGSIVLHPRSQDAAPFDGPLTDYTVDFSVNVLPGTGVPEPGSLALLGLGTAAMLRRRRR